MPTDELAVGVISVRGVAATIVAFAASVFLLLITLAAFLQFRTLEMTAAAGGIATASPRSKAISSRRGSRAKPAS